MERVSVFGLGKVGLALASSLTHAGQSVIGVEVNERIVQQIRDGQYDTREPGVMERVRASLGKTLSVTTDGKQAVADSDLTFVIVPSPSNALGGFSIHFIRHTLEAIGKAIAAKPRNQSHTIALVSTVLPGSSDQFLMPLLEETSGRKMGDGLGFVYNPAFIALGDVVKGFVEPDYLLLGQSDAAAGDRVLTALQRMVKNTPPVARMTPIEAEITKIASNTHETMRVSFANMLFSLCNEIPGANVDRITGALSHRMGKRFFKGAVPYGGPCWPRDNQALAVFMDAIGVPSIMPRTVDLFNAEHGKYLLRKCLEVAKRGQTVAILGMAYKPGTNVIERAFGVDLANWLLSESRQVAVWDPQATDAVRGALGDRVRYAATPEEAMRGADLTVLANPLREFEKVDWTTAGKGVVFDCWRCLKDDVARTIPGYRKLGEGPRQPGQSVMHNIAHQRLSLLTD